MNYDPAAAYAAMTPEARAEYDRLTERLNQIDNASDVAQTSSGNDVNPTPPKDSNPCDT